MNKLWTIITTTYSQQVKSKSFIIMLLAPFLFVLLSVGAGFLTANSMGNQSDDTDQIAVIAEHPQLVQKFVHANEDAINQKIKTAATANQKLKQGQIAGYLTVSIRQNQLQAQYRGSDKMDQDLQSSLMVSLNTVQSQLNLKQAQLSQSQLKSLTTQPQFDSIKTSTKHRSNQNDMVKAGKISALMVMIFVLYFFLLLYSSLVASEIAGEKGSKIIEVLFSSVSATIYFIGKFLGIVLVMLTQLIVYIVVLGAGYHFAAQLSFTKPFFDQNQTLVDTVIHNVVNINLLFILFGLLLAIILSAICGALVVKTQDASKAAQPVVYLTLMAFILALNFQNDPHTIVAQIGAYLPFFSSFFMPIQIINGNVSGLGIVISLLLNVAMMILLLLWVKRYYKGLMLQTDDGTLWQRIKMGMSYR